MIIWLASYPRSGNTYFRVLLQHLYGFQTHSVYSVAADVESLPNDTSALMRLAGQQEIESNIASLGADPATHIVKTHNLPEEDGCPAVVLVRDGRDCVVSYAYFLLKTVHGISEPAKDQFEATLGDVIRGNDFGGWSRNVNAWVDRVGLEGLTRYEMLIEDPAAQVAIALRRVNVTASAIDNAPPSFQQLKAIVPWHFRRGQPGSWKEEMPASLQQLFLERHGDALLRLGYPV